MLLLTTKRQPTENIRSAYNPIKSHGKCLNAMKYRDDSTEDISEKFELKETKQYWSDERPIIRSKTDSRSIIELQFALLLSRHFRWIFLSKFSRTFQTVDLHFYE